MEASRRRMLARLAIFLPSIFLPLHCSTFTAALATEPEPIRKTPVLLDCAIGNGTDDAFALALAAVDPTIDLVGVTTVSGNTEDRAWIACRLLTAIGKGDIPVAFGRGKQPKLDIGAQFQYRYHPAVLYGRTAKPVKQTAVELLHDVLSKREKTTIVCTGPLTNIAQLLAEHPDDKQRIEQIVFSADSENRTGDVKSARAVLSSGIRMHLVSPTLVHIDIYRRHRIFSRTTPLTMQLQTLYELDPDDGSSNPDIAAVALASADSNLKYEFTTVSGMITLADDGKASWTEGESPTRAVTRVTARRLMEWVEKQLTQGEPVLPRELANRTKPIERGGMPHRVHVFEDYETDIERRWWLAGIPYGTSRCRGMLTMDFDDQQGDTKTMYRAVVFNPVPGPPMGKNPRLSFRCWLMETDQLRVQIYSLSSGYHRYLSLTDLPQGKWLDLAVDMTAARRHDGSGGPLSEGERIDDIQFYVDPRAELLVDDIVLYDAGAEDEPRDFPRRIHFTGWFDTGKQGQEWPGSFEIPAEGGFFGKAARSLSTKDKEQPLIRVNLRGRRPLTGKVQLDFRYRIDKAAPIEIVLRDSASRRELRTRFEKPKAGSWQQASVSLRPGNSPGNPAAASQELPQADELVFVLASEGPLWVDDILLYEPANGSR